MQQKEQHEEEHEFGNVKFSDFEFVLCFHSAHFIVNILFR